MACDNVSDSSIKRLPDYDVFGIHSKADILKLQSIELYTTDNIGSITIMSAQGEFESC